MTTGLDKKLPEINKIFKKGVKSVFQVLVFFSIAFIIAILLRCFFFASFKIPTPSMEPTVLSGDFVYVNKLILGPRVFKYSSFFNGKKAEVFRLPGFKKIKHNDVLVFNFPYSDSRKLDMDLNVFYLKRCVAVPGDWFYIDNGIYKVKGCRDTLGYYPNQLILSKEKATDLPCGQYKCFPYDDKLNWNIKFFGPIYVPRKNDKLAINSQNIKYYKKIIEYETKKDISIHGSLISLNEQVINWYVFKSNYYFMAGDCVMDSYDSRYWGLLPEDNIVGKATMIWKSIEINTNKIRLNRIFKNIK